MGSLATELPFSHVDAANRDAARYRTTEARSGVSDLAMFRGQFRDGSLAMLVESEVIPRLIVAHGVAAAAEPADGDGATIAAREVEAFAPLTLHLEAALLLDHVDAMLARGVAVESVLVDLLAPTARTLGTWWEEDRCDFIDVTMGLWRLQEIVRELSARMPVLRGSALGRRRVLFAAMPGDQHGFGAILVDEMFRRHGWDSEVALDATVPDLLAHVGHEWVDIVGLTVSCDCHIERLPSAITALRSVSRNPGLRVLVGGPVFVREPSLATDVGADGTARDARLAVILADELVDAAAGDAMACG